MNWYELAENPRAITELYNEVPSLQAVRLREVRLNHNGPCMTLIIDLPRFPDKVPPRWKLRGYDAVYVQLDFWDFTSIQLTQWVTENLVEISITPTAEKQICLKVTSSQGGIQTVARSFRMVVHKRTLAI